MNGYIITSIDGLTGAVYATLTLDEHVLNETVFVDDVTDADLITKTLQDAYIKFQADIETNTPVVSILPEAVNALVGKEVAAMTFEATPEPVDLQPVL